MRIAAFLAVSLLLATLGVRLLRLSRRTSARPERSLGLAFLFAGASAWLLPLGAREGTPDATARAIVLAAQTGMSVAIALLGHFTWIVFRPHAAAARGLAPQLIAANLACPVALVANGTPLPAGPVGLAVLAARNLVLLWLFLESASYARTMRRRVALGLAEPLLANRFLLWAIWTGALAFIPLLVLALRVSGALPQPTAGPLLEGPWRLVLAALGGGLAVALVACWLAFFPTARYRRWIEAS
jgi:hypothetical protein